MILNEGDFNELLKTNKIYFSGSGAIKFKDITNNKDALFVIGEPTTNAMAQLSYQSFTNKNFADVLYASPVYLKEFYTLIPRA